MSAVVTSIIKSQIGSNVDIYEVDRSVKNPMNFVLDEADRQFNGRFTVFWVSGGAPDVFCLDGFTPTPVVFNARYVELASVVRNVIIDDTFENHRAELAEQSCLNLLSELSLLAGNASLAIDAFVRSVTMSGIRIPHHNILMDLELASIDSAYMVSWFYGILHEIGHFGPKVDQDGTVGSSFFSDHTFRELLQDSIKQFPGPESLKQDIFGVADEGSLGAFDPTHLRDEVFADLFATSVLLQATVNIMREDGERDFDFLHFVSEIAVALNVVVVIDRCKRTALAASSLLEARSNTNRALEMLYHPATFRVRLIMICEYLATAHAALMTDRPTPGEIAKCRDVILEVFNHYETSIDAVEKGMANAMRFAFCEHERNPNELRAYLEELSSDHGYFAKYEADQFFQLSDRLGVEDPAIKRFRELTADPSSVAIPHAPEEDLVYFVPWVTGPEGFERPFGLNTKHGHLVFIFVQQGELYKLFFEASDYGFADGYSLKTAAVIVKQREDLRKEIASRMPEGPFHLIVEGTSEFDQSMAELSNNSIWPEDEHKAT